MDAVRGATVISLADFRAQRRMAEMPQRPYLLWYAGLGHVVRDTNRVLQYPPATGELKRRP